MIVTRCEVCHIDILDPRMAARPQRDRLASYCRGCGRLLSHEQVEAMNARAGPLVITIDRVRLV